jgi:hypothetical protein
MPRSIRNRPNSVVSALNPTVSVRPAFVILFVLVAASSSFAADECSQLRSVVSQAANGFEQLRGAAQPNDSWRSTVILPGYNSCYLHRSEAGGDITLVCESPHFKKQDDASKAIMLKVKPDLQCLGGDWSVLSSVGGNVSISDKTGDMIGYLVQRGMQVSSDGQVGTDYSIWKTIYHHNFAEEQPDSTEKPERTPLVAPVDFCDDLKRVTDAATKNFQSILGKSHGSNSFASRVTLNGWDECSIGQSEQNGKTVRYQTCEIAPTSDKAELDAVAGKVDAAVKGCLGNDWARDDASKRRRCPSITYEAGDKDPTVEIRTSSCGRGAEWTLHLDVNAPTN